MRLLNVALAATALVASAFAVPSFAQDKGTIGIAMPTKSSARWISDGNSMVEQFQAAGLFFRYGRLESACSLACLWALQERRKEGGSNK